MTRFFGSRNIVSSPITCECRDDTLGVSDIVTTINPSSQHVHAGDFWWILVAELVVTVGHQSPSPHNGVHLDRRHCLGLYVHTDIISVCKPEGIELMTRKHMTKDEAAAQELYCKADLKKLFRLKPSSTAKPNGQVWQGQGAYAVYALSQCIPMKPYRRASDAQLQALLAGRKLIGTRMCPQCKQRADPGDFQGSVCRPCESKHRQADSRLIALSWLQDEIAILDTETTGLDDMAEIVEISAIDRHGNVLFDSLVRPRNPIPEEVTAIHGITNSMVATAPSWPDVYAALSKAIQGRALVIYNAGFDVRMIRQTCTQYGLEDLTESSRVLCAMVLYSEYWGEWSARYGTYRWQTLSAAAVQQRITIDGQAHRSLADVKTTLEVIKSVAGLLSDRDTDRVFTL